jgi:hypothetical protein
VLGGLEGSSVVSWRGNEDSVFEFKRELGCLYENISSRKSTC